MTLNQILRELELIANNHFQINSFGQGDVWEIATSGDIIYPLMWTTIDGVDISTRDKTEIYRFSLFFMDVVKNGEINEQEVLSDQLSIAKDVLAQLKHPSYEWTFQENVSSLEDFTERFLDSVSGWKMGVSLKLPFLSSRCVSPYLGNAVICHPLQFNYYVDEILQLSELYVGETAAIVNIRWGEICSDLQFNYYVDEILQHAESYNGNSSYTVNITWGEICLPVTFHYYVDSLLQSTRSYTGNSIELETITWQ